jgi:hypothetical protein
MLRNYLIMLSRNTGNYQIHLESCLLTSLSRMMKRMLHLLKLTTRTKQSESILADKLN